MKITCCLIAKDVLRTQERTTWFIQALISTRFFSETILCIQGKYDKYMVKSMAPQVEIVSPLVPLKAEAAFNFAAKFARNDWISVGCDDDYYAMDNVRVIQDSLHIDGAGVVYFPYYVIRPEENKFGIHWPPAPFTMEQLTQYNFISTAAIVHKQVLKETKGWRHGDHIAGDWDLWVRARREKFPFVYFPLPIYYQRFYSTSGFQKQVARVGQEAINQSIKEVASGTK